MRRPRGQSREEVFDFVQRRLLAGEPPTVREVQEAMGFAAVQSARAHLDALVAEGRLRKEPGQARAYRLPHRWSRPSRAVQTVSVPLLGHVQAGALTAAIEDPLGHVQVQTRHPASSLFALRVRGESMTGVGIWPDDLVIVRRQTVAENGDVVVALVEDEATVKTLRITQDQLVLMPENPLFQPIVLAEDELSVLGKVIEVRRHLEPHVDVTKDER